MNKYDGIDKRIVSNVKIYARNLKRHIVFRLMDIEDIEQELMCEILACINRFDKQYGKLEHFIRKVLKCRCANLLKTYSRKKRDSDIKFFEYSDEIHCDSRNDNYQSTFRHADFRQLMNKMSLQYQLLCRLLINHSVTEVSKILGVSHTTVSRDLKRIVSLFRCHENSENNFLGNRGEKLMGKNLSIIETSSAKELSELAVYDLADLNDQLTKLTNHAKELKEKFDDALNLRFAEVVKENLRKENKDTGTAKFIENGLQVVAEVPKKVTWDSEQMEQIIKTIPEDKCKAIVKTTHVIEERKYANLSYEYQMLFKPARTVTPGKAKFQIYIPEDQSDLGYDNF